MNFQEQQKRAREQQEEFLRAQASVSDNLYQQRQAFADQSFQTMRQRGHFVSGVINAGAAIGAASLAAAPHIAGYASNLASPLMFPNSSGGLSVSTVTALAQGSLIPYLRDAWWVPNRVFQGLFPNAGYSAALGSRTEAFMRIRGQEALRSNILTALDEVPFGLRGASIVVGSEQLTRLERGALFDSRMQRLSSSMLESLGASKDGLYDIDASVRKSLIQGSQEGLIRQLNYARGIRAADAQAEKESGLLINLAQTAFFDDTSLVKKAANNRSLERSLNQFAEELAKKITNVSKRTSTTIEYNNESILKLAETYGVPISTVSTLLDETSKAARISGIDYMQAAQSALSDFRRNPVARGIDATKFTTANVAMQSRIREQLDNAVLGGRAASFGETSDAQTTALSQMFSATTALELTQLLAYGKGGTNNRDLFGLLNAASARLSARGPSDWMTFLTKGGAAYDPALLTSTIEQTSQLPPWLKTALLSSVTGSRPAESNAMLEIMREINGGIQDLNKKVDKSRKPPPVAQTPNAPGVPLGTVFDQTRPF